MYHVYQIRMYKTHLVDHPVESSLSINCANEDLAFEIRKDE